MEIGEYLRGMAKKSWVVVLVIILAAGGTYAVMRGTKDTYLATVNVTVPADQSSTAGANGQYVANFSVGLRVASVVQQVSTETGAGKAKLTSSLKADQLGSSSFIAVTFVGESVSKAEGVVVSAAKATTALLAQPAVQTATSELTAAKASATTAHSQVKTATTALNTYISKHGGIDPHVPYQAAQSSITQLNVSKQQAIAAGRSTANFDSAISSAQSSLTHLAPQLAAFDSLSRTLNQAELADQTAQSRVVSATGQLADASAAPIIGEPRAALQTKNSTILHAVGIAAGLGLVLGLALLLLIELLAGRSRTRREVVPTPAFARAPATPTTPTPPTTPANPRVLARDAELY